MKDPMPTRVYGKSHDFAGLSHGTECLVCGVNFFSMQGDRVDPGCYGIREPRKDIPIPDHSTFKYPSFP